MVYAASARPLLESTRRVVMISPFKGHKIRTLESLHSKTHLGGKPGWSVDFIFNTLWLENEDFFKKKYDLTLLLCKPLVSWNNTQIGKISKLLTQHECVMCVHAVFSKDQHDCGIWIQIPLG